MKLITIIAYLFIANSNAKLVEYDVQFLATNSRANYDKQKGHSTTCPFCEHIQENKDEQHYIIYRSNLFVIMLNLYPYAAGHMLIMPQRHVGNLHELTPQEAHELIALMALASKACATILQADACNVGLNLGKAAGASIPEHVHVHVVPRRYGDSGFTATIGKIQVVDPDLKAMYKTLKSYFEEALRPL